MFMVSRKVIITSLWRDRLARLAGKRPVRPRPASPYLSRSAENGLVGRVRRFHRTGQGPLPPDSASAAAVTRRRRTLLRFAGSPSRLGFGERLFGSVAWLAAVSFRFPTIFRGGGWGRTGV
ncbi:hypothetical protein GCM10022402_13570 [Salinactinospora qingdaonensis]|uniref:Uncharacterized protein n=1 Tax=Salinactinospora qingdaonensis TaxID=702744 RepID=A0ABP7FA73_9ACTN